ncbi:hypothetical protein AX15_000110 [Amanita polypyramis BW_CC]|nr:hypothetical protein AX15_000110 [Amanita polypyramis BW_CC]
MTGHNSAWSVQDEGKSQGHTPFAESIGSTSSTLLERSSDLCLLPAANTHTASSVATGSGPAAKFAQSSSKIGRFRRLKPQIGLASDQPPTTQGRPRTRVYVACLQCRTRKIRCDGTKPVCYSCNQRSDVDCEYDPLPKRRGPDRTPGARRRSSRDRGNQLDTPAMPRRRRRAQEPKEEHLSEGKSEGLATPQPQAFDQGCGVSSPTVITANASRCRCHDTLSYPMSMASPIARRTIKEFVTHQGSHNGTIYSDTGSRYPAEVHGKDDEQQNNATIIEYPPSLSFARKIWWDSLLCLYLSPNAARLCHVTPDQRETAARSIMSDLKFIFRASNYWFSFFHIPTFFGSFCDPVRRGGIQPCLVLALLAMATLLRSSEVEMREEGRMRALRFRDEAQAALEASISSNWIDETVAQAAWVLAMFEICPHSEHSGTRAISALALLDSLIHGLSLTLLDVDDADSLIFSPRSVPSVPSRVAPWLPNDSSPFDPNFYTMSSRSASYISAISTPNIGCNCQALTLAVNWPLTDERAPLWGSTPAWHVTWNAWEIKKESCRRLCWSSLTLAAGHVSYMSANQEKPPDLFVTNPANYALLLSGEYTARLSGLLPVPASKDTIWALYDRSYLLWHACVRMRDDETVPEAEKAQFALKAWLEADALETALNKHNCNLERAFLFQAREYIFNIQMYISYEYQRWIPLVTAVNGLFHYRKAEEWLTHQTCVARRLMDGLHTVTGNSGNVLARRPFFVFWFMGQINRTIYLWEYDHTLTTALDVCKAFITAADYLSSLWPCPNQRKAYEKLRLKVDNTCRMASVSPPPPFNLSLSLEALV